VVVQAFFEAIQPCQLDALEAVLAKQQAERAERDRHWQERVKRAEYEAHLARRQYDAVDPDNRLVAAELERRWDEKLQQLHVVQDEYAGFQHTPSSPSLTPELRCRLQQIPETLPELWRSGRLTYVQKKTLLRSLIARVILKRTAPDCIEAKIVWVSGHFSIHAVRPPIHRLQDVTGFAEMTERIRSLWAEGYTDAQIAYRLNEAHFHSARAETITSRVVEKIRLRSKCYDSLHRSRRAGELDGCLTVGGLAKYLGVRRGWIYRRLTSGELKGPQITRHPSSHVYLFQNDPDWLAHLQLQVVRERHPDGGI
jgi:hypothetical protein